MKRPYLVVFAVFAGLVVATIVTVAVAAWHLPAGPAAAVALAVASVKASLVALFFMHLRRERRVVYGVVLLAGVLLVAMMGLVAVTERTQVARPVAPAPGRQPGAL
jgi:cytochrome c oxidase subunit 4